MSHEYKITVLGSGGVGKSALTIRLITGGFEANYDPTIEDSYRKQVQIGDEHVLMDILDTAGQEEYSALLDQWIREGDGFLVVYAINAKSTLGEAEVIFDKIYRILDEDKDDKKVPIVLVGNKSDLEHEREVPKSSGQAAAARIDAAFFEASAKEKTNVEESFFEVVRQIQRKKQGGPQSITTGTGKKKFCNLL